MIKPERAAWVVALFYFLLNIGFLSSGYNFDGTVFALQLDFVKAGASPAFLLHPHHLLFEPLGYGFWRLLALAGISLRSIDALEVFDLTLGSMGLAFFARALMLVSPQKKWAALLCMLGLGFSYSYWFHSVESEVYSLAVFFLILAFYAMLAMERRVKIEELSLSKKYLLVAMLSLLATLVIMGHLIHGLFGIIVIYFTITRLGRGKGISRAAPAFWVLICTGAPTGLIYLCAFLSWPLAVHKISVMPGQFKSWVLDLAGSANNFGYPESYWQTGWAVPLRWLKGMAWAFFSQAVNPGHPARKALLIVTLLVLAGYIISFLYILARDRGRSQAGQGLILLWLLTGLGWTMFWAPEWYEQKMYLLPAVWAAIFSGIPPAASGRKRSAHLAAIGFAVAILFAINSAYDIYPASIPENNRELTVARAIKQATRPGSVIVISGLPKGYNIGKFYIPYFSDRWAFTLDWRLSEPVAGKLFPQNLAARLDEYFQQGRPVYLLSDVLRAPIEEELAKRHQLDPKQFAAFWDRYELMPVADLDLGLKLFLLRPRTR
jgi:hypothetical protein